MPAEAEEPTVKVSVEDAPELIEAGLKAAVTPEGRPEAVRATVTLEPEVMVLLMVTPPLLPGAMETEEGEEERLKPEAVPEPVSAASSPVLGLPQPVTRS